MARVTDIKNPWGREGGPNPQRTDLWQVDLSEVIKGVNATIKAVQAVNFPTLPDVPRYFPASISIPEQKVRAEMVRRDSKPYNMPSWDEPLDSFKILFVMDDGGKNSVSDESQSTIYTILDIWRSLVRAGRGAMGAEPSIRLDDHYRIDYAWPIYLYMLKGYSLPKQFFGSKRTRLQGPEGATYEVAFDGDSAANIEEQVTYVNSAAANFSNYMSQMSTLEVAQILHFDGAWLSGFKVVDLDYNQASTAHIEASFFAESILQVRRSDTVPSFS